MSEGICLFCLLIIALPRQVFVSLIGCFQSSCCSTFLLWNVWKLKNRNSPDGNGAISNSSPFRARLHNVHFIIREHVFTDLVHIWSWWECCFQLFYSFFLKGKMQNMDSSSLFLVLLVTHLLGIRSKKKQPCSFLYKTPVSTACSLSIECERLFLPLTSLLLTT